MPVATVARLLLPLAVVVEAGVAGTEAVAAVAMAVGMGTATTDMATMDMAAVGMAAVVPLRPPLCLPSTWLSRTLVSPLPLLLLPLPLLPLLPLPPLPSMLVSWQVSRLGWRLLHRLSPSLLPVQLLLLHRLAAQPSPRLRPVKLVRLLFCPSSGVRARAMLPPLRPRCVSTPSLLRRSTTQ